MALVNIKRCITIKLSRFFILSVFSKIINHKFLHCSTLLASGSVMYTYACCVFCKIFYVTPYVTGFERTHLPRTQQEDTLFTITR